MKRALFRVGVLIVLLAVSHLAAGQGLGVRPALTVLPGASFDSVESGPSLGGAVTFDLSPRFALEGTGTYLSRGAGAHALSIQGGLLAHLASARSRIVPFVAAGAGIYRASFDLGAQRFFGGAFGVGPGASICGGTGVCPYGNLPAFYGNRLGAMTAPPAGGSWPTRTFTDPAFHLGAGVRIDLTSHLFVRPEIRGLFVAADNATQSLATVSVGFGYRF